VTRARALTALDRATDACASLERAEVSAVEYGDLPWLWRAQCALSRNYLAAGRRGDAEAKQAEARVLLLRLAEGLDEARRARFLAAAQTYVPPSRPPTARRAAKEQWGGLTEREREIAALVTRGLANREIAAELVLSDRTVETHIGNILSKLGFASRSQIAVWGAERRLQAD
jgi:DNA-binding CsgD family transcriptional regulator